MLSGQPRRYVERLYYVVRDNPDGSLTFAVGSLYEEIAAGVDDQRISPAWRRRDEAQQYLHARGLHKDGWRILKLAVPDVG